MNTAQAFILGFIAGEVVFFFALALFHRARSEEGDE